jgi:hypothetical protein
MSDEKRHVTPGLEPRHRLPSDEVSHDIGIGAQLVVVLEVAGTIHAKNESLGLVPDILHCTHSLHSVGEEISPQAS